MNDGRAAGANEAEWASDRETLSIEETFAVIASTADDVMNHQHEDDVFRHKVHALLVKTYHAFKDALDAEMGE